ncbi:hypothetical protein BB561_002878 [Smittium simulii]|uniref:NADH dehydrogenase [ubiquinone] 1 alpha subcomplex subunit n=1 Tax=Smittium simulii TaxID=133385 RepID=A0A2T9YP23_9FUNG|nr:hypothetical protein BB561_002878 [Smittium simulii]
MSLVRYLNFFFKNSPKQNFLVIRKLDDEKWGNLVGTDELGNKYYENKAERYGRHRWVLPAASVPASDASQIPPGWNQWLHNVSDQTPLMTKESTPIYKWMPAKHSENSTGTPGAFQTYNTCRPVVKSWTPAVLQR